MKETPSIAKDCLLVKKIEIRETNEQIQHDIITYMHIQFPALGRDVASDLCQIVVDNFNKLK